MANIKNASEARRVYPGYHERYGSSIIAWATSRGRIRNEFGLLLSFRGDCLPYPDIARSSRTGSYVSG